jgi:hypothetical protein
MKWHTPDATDPHKSRNEFKLKVAARLEHARHFEDDCSHDPGEQWYASAHRELASASAAHPHNNRISPSSASVLKKL